MLKLDYVSCILTIISTVLIGKKLWQGWVIAGANSIIICVIGMRSAQFGFVPANLFCIGLYANNLWNWRPKTRVPRQCQLVYSRPIRAKKVGSLRWFFESARDRHQPNVGVVGHVAAIGLGEALAAVKSQGHDRDIRILLLEPVNHRCPNRIRSGKADDNQISSRNHCSIQSKGLIVAQHGCDAVTAGFKHSSAGQEQSLIVRNL